MSIALATTAVGSTDLPASARPRWMPSVLIVWVLSALLLIWQNLRAIKGMEFHDPDDELRLIQVRDLLAGQPWFDLHQHRVDAADGGVLMHWSRLVDVPVAGTIALLRPLLGQAGAESAALLIVPALTLLAIMTLVGWMASRTLAPGQRVLSMIAILVAAPVIIQVMPLRIDHHGWQIVMALAAVAAYLDRDARRGGFLAGAALAIWMSISLEGLPFAAMLIGVLACLALWDPARTRRLAAAMTGLATTSAGLFLATRGLADLPTHCDAISPVHLAIFGWGMVAIGVPTTVRPASRMALIAGLGAAGAGALALIALAAPQCASGSFDMLDPVVRSFWYDNVREGKPLWQNDILVILQYGFPPLIGLWAATSLLRRSAGEQRDWWIFFTLILAGAIVMALLVSRSASIAGALAALPIGWRMSAWIEGLKRPPNPVKRVAELVGVTALIFCCVLPSVPAAAIQALVAPDKTGASASADPKVACNARFASAQLDALPDGDVLAPLDFGPNIMLNSRKGVLATGHHRGAAAMRQVIDAFTGTPEQARAIMARYDLRFVMICPSAQELDLDRKRGPHGFAAQLVDGKVPTWLKRIPLPAASGFYMWAATDGAVRPAGNAAPRR